MRYLINTDWFELVIKPGENTELFDKNGFRISSAYKPKEVNGFLKCNQITYENQTFGKLYSIPSPRLRYEDRSVQLLRLNNETLYRSGVFETELPGFIDSYSFSPVGIKELHIALDGEGILARHEELFKKKNLRRERSVKNSSFTDDSTKTLTGRTLGSKQSDKSITIYNKTRELEKSKKKYISDCWTNNKLEIGNAIDRLELRLKSQELRGLENNLPRFGDSNFLASLLKAKTESYLTFIDSKTKRQIHVIDWKHFKAEQLKKEKIIHFKQPTQSIKTTLKILFLERQQCELALEIADELALRYGLYSWYQDKQARWSREAPFFRNRAPLK